MKMSTDYSQLKISSTDAAQLAAEALGVSGKAEELSGERDFNYKFRTSDGDALLKISTPDELDACIEFQSALLHHLSMEYRSSTFVDEQGETRHIRLLPWVAGRIWSSIKPITPMLLHDLGQKAGELTAALQDFEHVHAARYLEWDIATALWCKDQLHLFEEDKRTLLASQLDAFEQFQTKYNGLRKSVVHNDVNDNNIVVSDDLQTPTVKAIIDFGDATFTQTINDLAIALAYAIMDKENPLDAASQVVSGYHKKFPLRKEELEFLHTLVSMRLTITVTKAAMNHIHEPDNSYHQVSAKPAWDALFKWAVVNPELSECHFRVACGFDSHPNLKRFKSFCSDAQLSIRELIPEIEFDTVEHIDMSVGSHWLGHESEYTNRALGEYKFSTLFNNNPSTLFAGGYLESRPFYSTAAYKEEGNGGSEYRTVHLGLDVWAKANTPVHAWTTSTVQSVHDNNIDKDYGPTVILRHDFENGDSFYSLYGHLSRDCLANLKVGMVLEKGDVIGHIGAEAENGGWIPHLHFQLMLTMLDFDTNYFGVATPNSIPVWKDICPDPALLFKEVESSESGDIANELIHFRKEHLGKSLSTSYESPLHIKAGSDVYLIDASGRRYLDTINNVAHVGHEHPRVVEAGRKQMAILNTNTRYLHEAINKCADALLETLPEALSVVHFVNSGSEANELAMRMCKTATGELDMIAVETGYHGNTQACIDVSSYKFDGKGGQGAPEHTHIVPLPDSFRGLYRGKEQSSQYAKHIQEQIDFIQSKGRSIAGFICESILSCGGQIELPSDYLATAYKAVRNAGGLCIADEVQVGLGRAGHSFWGFELQNVVPDIVTIGKPFGNGHPIAAVVCTKEVANAFANGMEYFNTFGGNPVSCTIGLEVLNVVKDERLQQNALEVGTYFKESLKTLAESNSVITDVRGQGLFLGFELTDSKLNPLDMHATYLVNRMRELGILMSTDGKDNNVIKIKPPLTFSREHVDECILRLKSVLSDDYLRQID